MTKLILERKKVELSESQIKLVKSGWGADAVEKTTVEKITYLSDGLKIKGYIAYPKNADKVYPSVIWCRGGFGNAGAIDEFNATGIFGQLASWGYVVFASQYRGNDGGEGEDEFGGSDVNDVLNLIPLAEEIPFADKDNWGIEGWSRGGMMTYLALTKTDIFKTAITIGGITDLQCAAEESKFMKHVISKALGKNESDYPQKCSERSILNKPERLSENTPLLIIHGNADRRIPPSDSIELARKLLDLKREFRLMLLENGDHFLKSHRALVDNLRKEWFAKYLIQ
ncbi:MAG: prolyl oligopeptidase family serine peptidase [Chlorobi bacterium]|nr:prolyl oligopeptidase family serine peptidase [Chlorobiota bacterium]